MFLVWTDSDGREHWVDLERDCTRIGRSFAADVFIDDPAIARRHALVLRQPDGFRLVQDGPQSGVVVNDEQVGWHVLHDGDELRLGSHVLRVHAREPAAAPYAPPDRLTA